jgi:hypothetical protein
MNLDFRSSNSPAFEKREDRASLSAVVSEERAGQPAFLALQE